MSVHSQRSVEGCLKHTLRSWGHSDPHFLSVSRFGCGECALAYGNLHSF